MPFAAAITSTTRNARRCQSGHSGSEEETRYDGNGNVYYQNKMRPLNPNRNDYEDIENPFRMPSEVSKSNKKFGRECCFKTSLVVMTFIVFILVMLFCTLVFKNIPFLRIT